MIQTVEIEQMSIAERLQAMELLWRSLSANPKNVSSPDWHQEVLRQRLVKVDSGKGKFLTLAQLEKRLNDRAK